MIAADRRIVAIRRFALLAAPVLLAGCGWWSAHVPEGCYRFRDDGAPLFKLIGDRGYFVSKRGLRSFRLRGWDDLSRTSIEVTPAFVLSGLPAGDPERGTATAVTSVSYGKLEFERRGGQALLRVPVAAWGEEEVVLGAPC